MALGYALIFPTTVVLNQPTLIGVVLTGGSTLNSNLNIVVNDGNFNFPVTIPTSTNFASFLYQSGTLGPKIISATHTDAGSSNNIASNPALLNTNIIQFNAPVLPPLFDADTSNPAQRAYGIEPNRSIYYRGYNAKFVKE